MILLNLKANDEQQEVLKTYLQENVSESLAEKINNGVFITKDNKTLLSKKDLDGFIEYACKKAQEQAEKGKHSAMLKDTVVFGWAMHYFEEDSIEGKLFNPDGTPYEKPKPKYTPKPASTVTPPPKKDIQPNMFDLLCKNEDADNKNVETEETDTDDEINEEDLLDAQEKLAQEEDNPSVDEICDRIDKELDKNKNVNPVYKSYLEMQQKYPDCIIAYRLGDFYEIFGENAVKVSESIDLTLTGRDVGLPERIPIVGFPYHAADNYINKIIQKGYKVATVESLNDITIRNNSMKIDGKTGELLKPPHNDLINVLTDLFGNNMEIRL